MRLFLLWLSLTCHYLGSSVACDLDDCSTEYTRTFTSDPGKGCRRLNAKLCRKWRSYHACLENTKSRCTNSPFLVATRVAEATRILDCYCSDETTVSYSPFDVGSDFPFASGASPNDVPPTCTASEPVASYTACVLFGDPHLVTVAGREQTCSLRGRHKLFEFGEVSVDTVNVRVDTRLNATGTSKVIVRYASCLCAGRSSLRYTATAWNFRATFDDGSSPEHLIQRRHQNLVELRAAWLGITIRIRRMGMYVTIAIQLPSEVRSAIGGLCVTGCPTNELLEYKLPSVSVQVVPPHVAQYACDRVEEGTFFFKSCVFDFVMTGDRNFTLAALEAMNDVKDLQVNISPSRASERLLGHTTLLLTLALVSLLLTSKIDEFV